MIPRQSIRGITNYGVYRHDVRVEHPPKFPPKIWRLPLHRKLVYVNQGWYYRRTPGAPPDAPVGRTTTSVVTLVKSGSHKLLESLSYDIVEITNHSEPGLSKISTICGNKKGWVQDDKLYTCIDYTMILLKDKNKIWKIKVLSTD